MSLDVTIENETQSILPRTEYTLSVTHTGATPTRHDIKQQAQLHIDDDKQLLIIRSMPTKQNGKTFTVQARQYDDEAAMHHLEHDDMIAKNQTSQPTDDEDEDEDGDES